MLHTPSPVFLELIMRFDPQQKKCKSTKHNGKHLSKVSGVDVFSVLFFCLIKLILKQYFSVVILGSEGSFESNIYHINYQPKVDTNTFGWKSELFFLWKRKYWCDLQIFLGPPNK